ncbi:Os06g0494250 [Oryza sativa Japonica Group]|uniref:Os06g0494250 protein n=2 Tax=Oryza TaxID=4527 RepID=A0A0P0WXD0_ORYSJ|nr:hypothetical protein EE612_034305 [Oryza sativa]BAS97883.1 Os06g0494250 [Oryza sativa Japonica Group]
MEVCQSLCRSKRNVKPCIPVEQVIIFFRMENPLIQRPIRHVLVGKKPVWSLSTKASEFDKMDVVDTTNDRYLRAELFLSLAYALQLLHSNTTAVWECTKIHRSKPSLTKLVTEVACRILELPVSEPHWCSGYCLQKSIIFR